MTPRSFKRALKSLREATREIQPDRVWVKSARENLLKEISHARFESIHVAAVQKASVFQGVFVWIRGPVSIAMSVFVVLLGSSIASVSAAEKSLPGDLLYPVKLATEQTRMLMAPSSADKLKLKTEFVGRRVQEVKDIVALGTDDKQQRLGQAVEILKRDLDTVKGQLHDASNEAPTAGMASAAKLLDQNSNELVDVLKEAKGDMPDDIRSKVTEAEVAAVNTGVKAVQVLIDTRQLPEVKDMMSDEELLKVVNNRIEGMEAGIKNATSNASSTSDATSTSTQQQIKTAQTSIAETKLLVQENNLDAVKDKLSEVASAILSIENSVEASNASSSAPLPATTSTSTAAPVSSSSTNAVTSTPLIK